MYIQIKKLEEYTMSHKKSKIIVTQNNPFRLTGIKRDSSVKKGRINIISLFFRPILTLDLSDRLKSCFEVPHRNGILDQEMF